MNGNPRPLVLEDPLDVDQARHATRLMANQRREAERFLETVTREAADAEAAYRKGLAKAFADVDEGTAAFREAKARASVADLSLTRDIKSGMVKVALERLRGLEGERSMLKSLIDWSSRIDEETRERIGREAVA